VNQDTRVRAVLVVPFQAPAAGGFDCLPHLQPRPPPQAQPRTHTPIQSHVKRQAQPPCLRRTRADVGSCLTSGMPTTPTSRPMLVT
jgi:hypothetical protein